MAEAAALAGYNISGAIGQDLINKIRAQRRVNMIKADIISRYGGKWDANYREGWLELNPLSGNMNYQGAKILMPDGAYYKIASVVSDTQLVLTHPYQGTLPVTQPI